MIRSALFFAMLGLAPAVEACTAIQAPAVLDSPGCYRLDRTVTVSTPGADGFVIRSPGVVLDLGGHAIVGPSHGTGNGVSILGGDGATVRNGNIRGFLYGVRSEQSADVRVERLDLSDNLFRGVHVSGPRAMVLQNRIKGLAGTPTWPDSHTIGIEVIGGDCHIATNTIVNVAPQRAGFGVGIHFGGDNGGCLAYENHVSFAGPSPQGRTIGFLLDKASRLDVFGNVVSNADYAVFRDHVPGAVHDNLLVSACAPWWEQPDLAQRNTLPPAGRDCTDTEAYLLAQEENDDEGVWSLRLGTYHSERENMRAAARSWREACRMGVEEGCRLLEARFDADDRPRRRRDFRTDDDSFGPWWRR